jgi:hypothetical protein
MVLQALIEKALQLVQGGTIFYCRKVGFQFSSQAAIFFWQGRANQQPRGLTAYCAVQWKCANGLNWQLRRSVC